MTWTLHADGHLQDKASEESLVEDLRGVLAKYGTKISQFAGTFVGLVEDLQVKAQTPVPATIAGPKAAVVPEPVTSAPEFAKGGLIARPVSSSATSPTEVTVKTAPGTKTAAPGKK